jgi:zinc/manganese transport system permease protein
MLQLMTIPVVLGVILTGILSYLGIQIVKREVIFVDLALAQIAALGAAIGALLGLQAQGIQAYAASLGFVLLGALLFAFTKTRNRDVPQEAIIGITYAVAAAASVLAFNRAPGAAEKIQDMLLGNVLFASAKDVWIVLGVSFVVGAFHLVFRRNFLLISHDPDEAAHRGIRVAVWDFLFYASLGLVVVSAVGVVGILLVFSYLIIPAVCAMLLAPSMGVRTILAWVVGVVATFLGVYLSVKADTPTGATMVCTFAGILFAVACIRAAGRLCRPSTVSIPSRTSLSSEGEAAAGDSLEKGEEVSAQLS